MDFLNPKKRKAHKRRLFIGYVLMAIVVAIGTMTILYLAYGYDVDRTSGTVIQNGIVFVDSKPRGATVYVNNIPERSRTDTSMRLPAGVYTVRLEAPGFRTWERTFNLEGGEIERLVYPFLLPNNLVINDVKQYAATPQLATQSPDRRWVVVQQPGQTYLFDVFDLSDPIKAPTPIAVPVTMLTEPSAEATLEAVEWSTNNRHVLFKRTYGGQVEFLILDREDTTSSVNLTTLFGIKPVEVSLKNKRPDQVYYQESVPGVLRSADTKNRTISAPLLSGVIKYKTYGDDIVLFVTREGAETGKTDFKILEGDKIYNLKTASQSDNYVLDISRYKDQWYYVAGSSVDNMTFVYRNPLSALKQEVKSPLTVTAILRLENPRFASFSANTQFIGVQSGSNIITLDLEQIHQYRLKLGQDLALTDKVQWMDGNRYQYVYNQQSYIIDFDGSNEQTLVTTRLINGPFFDRDYDNVFTIEGSKQDAAKAALTMTIIDNQ